MPTPEISFGWKTWESLQNRELWLFGWALPTVENMYLHVGVFSLPLEENAFSTQLHGICGWPNIRQREHCGNFIDWWECFYIPKMEETSTWHTQYCETMGWTPTKLWNVERDVALTTLFMDSVSVLTCFVWIFLKTYGEMTCITD